MPGTETRRELTLSFLTPHSKWSIHSEYQDNLQHVDALPRRLDALAQP